MMKNKKNIIIVSITFLTFIILIIILNAFIFKNNQGKNIITKASNVLIKQLKNENISGITKFELDVYSSVNKEKTIIKNAKYISNYQINLKDGHTNIELIGDYDGEKITSNIYMNTDQIYITLEDIYDKNILFNTVKNLDYFTSANETSELIKMFIKELNNITKNSSYLYETEEKKGEKINKITLDITKQNNPKLRKKLINNLIENKKFIETLSRIKRESIETIKFKIKNEYIKDYKLVLYTNKKNKEFIKAEIKINDIDLKITKKNNKYHYEYYMRDGLEYNGYIEMRNNKLKKINIINNIYHYIIDIKIDELEIKYNNKLEKIERSKLKEETVFDAELEREKDNILKNNTINNIYNNYLNRYPKPKKETTEKIENPQPAQPVVPKEEDLNREVINGVG